MLEALSGCEMPNKYFVSGLSPGGERLTADLFKCEEKSGCCERQFCPGNVRPLDIIVRHVSPNSQKDMQPFLQIEKPCKCTMLCFCRPEIKVNLVEGGQVKPIGRIEYPF